MKAQKIFSAWISDAWGYFSPLPALFVLKLSILLFKIIPFYHGTFCVFLYADVEGDSDYIESFDPETGWTFKRRERLDVKKPGPLFPQNNFVQQVCINILQI